MPNLESSRPRQSGANEIALVVGLALTAILVLGGQQATIRVRKQIVLKQSMNAIQSALAQYLQRTVDCPRSRLAGCNTPTSLLSSTGSEILPNTPKLYGMLEARAACDSSTNAIYLNLVVHGKPFGKTALICN